MKTPILNMLGSLLVIGTLTVSCNSCNKDKDASANDAAVTTTGIDTTTAAGSETDDMATDDVPTGTGSNTVNAKTTAIRKGADGKKATDKGGYSAPDGTDAENHDGDMYTKNDTTRMPSGSVPIK